MTPHWSDRLVAAVYRIRLRNKLSGQPERNHRISNPWHAVSIAAGECVCDSAAKLRDQRVLSSEAPKLPLPTCEYPGSCTCRYRHHADRRSDRRRARDNGLPGRDFMGTERRTTVRGRRSTDI